MPDTHCCITIPLCRLGFPHAGFPIIIKHALRLPPAGYEMFDHQSVVFYTLTDTLTDISAVVHRLQSVSNLDCALRSYDESLAQP